MSRRLVLTAGLVIWAGCTAAAPAGETFKDWALRCHQGAGCVLEQRVLLGDDDSMPLLHVVLQYSGRPPVLDAVLLVPLGVLLAPGLSLSIDGGAAMEIPFHHCRAEGCLALLKVSDRLAAALRRGAAARVGYRLTDGRALAVPLSLQGITAGLRALGAAPSGGR